MKVLSFYMLFHYLCLPYDLALQSTYAEKTLVKISAVLALLNITANYVLYDMFGLIGIAFSTLIVKAVRLLLVFIKVQFTIRYAK